MYRAADVAAARKIGEVAGEAAACWRARQQVHMTDKSKGSANPNTLDHSKLRGCDERGGWRPARLVDCTAGGRPVVRTGRLRRLDQRREGDTC